MNRLQRVVVACGIGVAPAVLTGCFGHSVATVQVSNYCSGAVEVGVADQLGTNPEEWIRLDTMDRGEVSTNSPGGSPVYLEVRAAPAHEGFASTYVQATDGSDVHLQNSVCPAG